MALYQSAGRATELENIGRNVVVASKSGPVETGPTILVATALSFRSQTVLTAIRKKIYDLGISNTHTHTHTHTQK